MTNTYSVGANVRMKTVFTNPDTGSLVDPTEVFLRVRSPNETVTEYNYASGGGDINRLSSGTYYMDKVVDNAGIWFYYFFASGTGASADQHYFEVEEPNA